MGKWARLRRGKVAAALSGGAPPRNPLKNFTHTPMLKIEHKFVMEMLKPDGASLGLFSPEVDWEPAREYVRLLGLRRGLAGGEAVVEPVWDEKTGEPNASGARLTDGAAVGEIAREYFKPLAVGISGELVEKKILKPGELFLYKILAFRNPPEPANGSGFAFSVRDTSPPLPFIDSPLSLLESASVACGEAVAGDVPVFIPQHVFDEAEALTLEAGEVETGGILIGNIHRDAGLPEIAVVITAQIPARHTESKTTSLTYTADTWTAVQAALDLRKSDEVMLGWWHSHPSFKFCNAECPPERRRDCALQKPFLSGDDLLLHRAVFPKAYHIALLANLADAGLDFSLYGWRHGVVRRRGFNVLGATERLREKTKFSTQTSTGETDHDSSCEK